MAGYQSWGLYPTAEQRVQEIGWSDQEISFAAPGSYLPYGQGRSYGDCCLNDGGTILLTKRLNHILSFDAEKGLLVCEAGMTLAELLDFAVPRGWFLPVTPGTKYVSVGGAIANDVHGKNHHRAGTFGCFVRSMGLLRSSGERWVLSATERSEYFAATIGGLGLTGLIMWAELQLIPVAGPFIEMESIKFGGLDEFFAISARSDQEFDYTVAWLDCLGRDQSFGRGIFMRGNHSELPAARAASRVRPELLAVPFFLPPWALQNWSVGIFNSSYYQLHFKKFKQKRVHYDGFFYPLDRVAHWNRIYGKRGFLQFQCVVPAAGAQEGLKIILQEIVKSGRASFLAVVKEFGDQASPGLMSFPQKGVTLCLDFPNEGQATFDLFDRLDVMVWEQQGRLYPAKDARMPPASFRAYYPGWQELEQRRDPRFSSSLWRRLTQE